jgi:hypothetical protein
VFCAEKSTQSIEEKKIYFLLNTIEASSVTFIRNGKEHTAGEAKKHLENKMNYARRAFWLFGPKADITVENFITKIASKSSQSDQEYKVRLRNGEMMTTNEWLRKKLKTFNQTRSRPVKK